jgi:hypothetical protein
MIYFFYKTITEKKSWRCRSKWKEEIFRSTGNRNQNLGFALEEVSKIVVRDFEL